MYYATIDNKIGNSENIPEGAIEISDDKYLVLLSAKIEGGKTTIVDGQVVSYTQAFSKTGEPIRERDPELELITTPPPEGLHKPLWVGGEWTESESDQDREDREREEIKALVPQTVTRFQAKAALHHAGLLPQVQEYIDNSGDVLTQLAWVEASFHRNSNMVATIGAELGLTEAAIDDLFITAASINV